MKTNIDIQSEREMRIAIEKLKAGALYFFLLAGGLWHILGVFQTVMRISAGAVIIGLAIWVAWETRKTLTASLRNYDLWCIAVLVLTFLIEFAGVLTGAIFGSYQYGETLQPQIGGTPLAIGFAWLVMLLSSVAVAQRLLPGRWLANFFIFTLVIGVLMVLFDAAMEPAAIRLGYWNWTGGEIPLQNYRAWFVISAVFAAAAFRLELFRQPLPAIAFHAYVAQLLYFGLVYLA